MSINNGKQLYDSEVFTFDLPLWFIGIIEEGHEMEEIDTLLDERIKTPIATNSNNEHCFAMFTDQDLAERFAAEMKIERPTFVRVRTLDKLEECLIEVISRGCDRILFDPGDTNKRPQSQPAMKVLNAISDRITDRNKP